MTSGPKATSAGNFDAKFWVLVAAAVAMIILTGIYVS